MKDAVGSKPRALIHVLCVEDHHLVRDGITLIIEQESDMEVVGAAASADEALRLFRHLRPDVTLMDLRLPGRSGVDAIGAIRREDASARIVVLTMYEGDEDIRRAMEAGAVTYLNKDVMANHLIQVIRDVHAGRRPISPEIRACLDTSSSHSTLTPRETAVLELVAEGMRNKEVAASLGITRDTVIVHLRNIFEKLNVNDRTAAIRIATRRGFIHDT